MPSDERRNVRWLEAAAEELYTELRRMEDRSLDQAQAWYQRVSKTAALLADNPKLGREGRVQGTREAVVPGTTHIIVYQEPDNIVENELRILALRDGRRPWPRGFKSIK